VAVRRDEICDERLIGGVADLEEEATRLQRSTKFLV
jgi:hypothetical protein